MDSINFALNGLSAMMLCAGILILIFAVFQFTAARSQKAPIDGSELWLIIGGLFLAVLGSGGLLLRFFQPLLTLGS